MTGCVRGWISLFLAFVGSPLLATDEPTVEGRVVGKIWHARVGMADSFDFMKSVQNAIGLKQNSIVMMMPSVAHGLGSSMMSVGGQGSDAEPPELKGSVIFLQTAPEPNLDASFAFEYVGSHKEFLKRLKAHASRMGSAAELLGEEDRYEIKLRLQQMSFNPPPDAKDVNDQTDDDGKPEVRSFSVVISADVGSSSSGTSDDTPAAVSTISTYFRYVDGLMYTSRLSILHDVDLPSPDELQLDDTQAANDVYADFDLSEIPIELKRAFWNALETSASTWLQRFDNERAGEYSLRRSMGQGRLELIRAGLFDVERVRFSLKLPQEDKQVTVGLRVTARENSRLASTLDQLGRQKSQLAALEDESSPLVVSSSLLVPEWTAPVTTNIVDSLRLRLREAADDDGALSVLIDDLMEPLMEAARSRSFDAAFNLRGTPETGLVLQAGLRLPDAEQFLSSLQTTLNVLPSQQFVVSPMTVGDYRGIVIRTHEPVTATEHLSVPVQMHLAATGSWLWITCGGETASDALAELVERSQKRAVQPAAGMPLHIQFRLSQWLEDSNDEYSAMPRQALGAFERWLAEVTRPQMMTMSMQVNGKTVELGGGNKSENGFTSYAGKLLNPENSDLDLKVRTFGRELSVDAQVGTGVIYFAAAQYVAAQANMFSNIPINFSTGDGKANSKASIRIGR